MHVRGVSAEGADSFGVTSRRHGDMVPGRSDIDGGGVKIDFLELRRKRRSFRFAFRSGWHVFGHWLITMQAFSPFSYLPIPCRLLGPSSRWISSLLSGMAAHAL